MTGSVPAGPVPSGPGPSDPGPSDPVPADRAGRSPTLRGLARLVGLARALAGGLVVLALVVAVLPPLLGDRGPGAGVVGGHVAGALAVVAATGVAGARRTPRGVAVVAAAAVPVIVLVVLGTYWWS